MIPFLKIESCFLHNMQKIIKKNGLHLVQAVLFASYIKLFEGVYIQTSGPNYETPAEIRAYEKWGADAVGMSTACEAMAARHAGMRVCGISCISNMAAGLNAAPLTHEDIKKMAEKIAVNGVLLENDPQIQAAVGTLQGK